MNIHSYTCYRMLDLVIELGVPISILIAIILQETGLENHIKGVPPYTFAEISWLPLAGTTQDWRSSVAFFLERF